MQNYNKKMCEMQSLKSFFLLVLFKTILWGGITVFPELFCYFGICDYFCPETKDEYPFIAVRVLLALTPRQISKRIISCYRTLLKY